jgi:general secretion pathway protein A
MYYDFYQLREAPFNVTPDPKFLYLNARYREAIASLNYGITQRKGFITLIGEAGTGKTTLLNKLLEELDSKTKSVFIFNTNVTFEEILEYVFVEFGLPVHNGKKLYMLQRLNAFLLEELRGGGNVALLIDEAQDLEFSVLEDLRLLSNLETAKEKILQIVLSGQPELGQKLSNPILRQLRQRIGINCRLLPLSRDEISEYIEYRLQAAGCPDLKLFSREAEDQIYRFSRGIPRLVNVVCDNALLIGYALGKKRIGAEVVTEAAADLLSVESGAEPAEAHPVEVNAAPARTVAGPRRRWRLALAVGVALVVGAGAFFAAGRMVGQRTDARPVVVTAPPRQLEVIRPGSQAADVEVARAVPTSGAEVPATAQEAVVHVAPRPPSDAPTAARADGAEPAVANPVPAVGVQAAAPAVGVDRAPPGPLAGARVVVSAPERPAPPPAAADAARPVGAAVAPDIAVAAGNQLAEVAPTTRPHTAAVAVSGRASDALSGVTFTDFVVRSGDSLSGIAKRTYGQSSYTILDLVKLANPDLKDVNLIAAGQTLRMPELREGLPVLGGGTAGYQLLVLSTPQERRAAFVQETLRGHGFNAQIAEGDLGTDNKLYRVVVAGGGDPGDAAQVGRRVQQAFRDDVRLARLGE